MRKIFALLFVLISTTIFCQESIFDKVAIETCEYMNSKEVSNLTGNDLSNKLGVFIVQRYNEYKDEFVAADFDLDFTKGEDEATKLGEKIGLTMVNHCPDILIALSENMAEDDDSEVSVNIVKGEILSIEESDFTYVFVQDEDGKRQKLYWIQNFAGSFDLTDMQNWKEKKVAIEFVNFECYSAQLKEYITKKEIVSIEYL